jgi:hypothetical protein
MDSRFLLSSLAVFIVTIPHVSATASGGENSRDFSSIIEGSVTATQLSIPPETTDNNVRDEGRNVKENSRISLNPQNPEISLTDLGEKAELSSFNKAKLGNFSLFASSEKSVSTTAKKMRKEVPLTLSQSVDVPNFNPEINDEVTGKISELPPMSQVTSVNQLSDVQPTDWAFQALQSLVERYGCIAGYPDGTFKGNRAITRYEFAAGLNACLDQMSRLIAAGTADKITQSDLVILQKLQEIFAAELSTLRGRVDVLQARTKELENNQFTRGYTSLGGEVIFGLSDAWGGKPPGTGKASTSFFQTTRLATVTTFTGKDRLRMELQAGNFACGIGCGFADVNVLNTNTALLSYQADTQNKFRLSYVEYRFPAFNDRVVFTLRPWGFDLSSVLTTNSPYYDSGRGAISRFGQAPPIFFIGNLDAGVGMDWLINSKLRLQLAYGARNAANPDRGTDVKNNFFNDNSWAAGLQILTMPTKGIQTGLTFVYAYSPLGELNTYTGSLIADTSGLINQRSDIYALNGTFQWRLTPQVTFSTWGGVTYTRGRETSYAGSFTTNYMFGLGLSDPFKREGDLLAFMFGQPPKMATWSGLSIGNAGLVETSSSFHIETFYRFTVTDNISITPGFFMVTHPGNIDKNNTIYVGTIRTTFRF